MTSPQADDLLDFSRLAAIAAGSGKSNAAILQEFKLSNAPDEALMRVAISNRDFEGAAVLAHRLRGAAMMVGAGRFAATCVAIAHASKVRDARRLRDALTLFDRQALELHNFIGSLETGVAGAPVSSTTTHAAPCSGLAFIVVEDHEFQRAVMTRLLEKLGARRVLGFGDAEAALRRLDDPDAACDIMLLDLALPGMGAMALLRAIGERRHTVGVILNSAINTADQAPSMATGRSLGVTMLGALGKPLTEASLVPLIDHYRGHLATHAATQAEHK